MYTGQKAENILLDRGVKIATIKTPLFAKLRGCFKFHVVIKQPTLAELYRMSAIILSMNLPVSKLMKMNILDSYYILNGSARKACEVMSIVCKRYNPLLTEGNIAKMIFESVTAKEFAQLWEYCLYYTGVADFTITIRYMYQKVVYLSPRVKGSQHTLQ